MTKDHELDQTNRLMGALVHMPPKPHEEMTTGIALLPELSGA